MMCYHIDGLSDTTRLKLDRLLAGEAFAGALWGLIAQIWGEMPLTACNILFYPKYAPL